MKCINLDIKKILIFLSIIIIIFLIFILFININNNHNNSNNIFQEKQIKEIDICEESCDENNLSELLNEKFKEKKLIALTFDDGPSKYTKKLLESLNEKNVNATFFLIGDNIRNYKDVLLVMNEYGEEIAIHSYVHKLFTRISDEEIHKQIELTKDEIHSITDVDINLIRVPYGSLSERVLDVIANENLTSVLWDVDSLDWKLRNKDKIYNYVLKKLKGNQIILMHDTYETSVEAAIKLIEKLQDEDYYFVTVSDLLNIKSCNQKL